jgi:serine/threonine-protein kinase SRPK3
MHIASQICSNAYPVKYVAVKALTSYASNATLKVNREYPEIDMLEHIKEKANSSTHPGARHLVKLYDTFEEKSDHGDHVCIVTEILAGDLLDLCHVSNMGNALSLALVKKVVKQHLEGLAFLHKTCNIVHTGVWLLVLVENAWLTEGLRIVYLLCLKTRLSSFQTSIP